MGFRVIITRRAESEMLDSARWWATERSIYEGKRWLAELEGKLQSLSELPKRCPLAPENGQFPFELRELHYGITSRATHHAVFTIMDDLVLVLAVRHGAQDRLEPEDISI